MQANVLKYKLDWVTLEHIYVAFIRSNLEYTTIVGDNCTQELSDLIESVQYRAGKMISQEVHQTSQDLVYTELGWVYLKEHCQMQRLKVMYNIVKHEAPLYLRRFLPEAEEPQYKLRNIRNFLNIRGHTKAFNNSFLPKIIYQWNSLARNVVGCSNT